MYKSSFMNIKKGEIMDNLKKVGITALAGSLAAFSANAAEMSVSGATLATYTSEGSTGTTGTPLGLKTNLVFSASGEVNGYTVSYFQVSADQFAGMSSAGLAIDMGDIGSFGIEQTTTAGIASIDDKTPTAAEEVWDGLDSQAAGVGARVGATAGGTSFVYKNSVAGMGLNVAVRPGSAGVQADGASSGDGEGSSYGFALTGLGSAAGIDGLDAGVGFGKEDLDTSVAGQGDIEEATAYVNYSFGPVTAGYQKSVRNGGAAGANSNNVDMWGVAFNVNENLSLSYGEIENEVEKASASNVTESFEGVAISYTMGSMTIAANRNEASALGGTTGTNDSMTEIALSFAF